jgi:hypothetical protein
MRGSSPFSNYQDFYEATGPIYTFADRPAIIGILFVVSAFIFLYFIYATYTTKKGSSDAKSPVILGLLLATSLASAADALYNNSVRNTYRQTARVTQPTEHAHHKGQTQPLALLGMVGVGAGTVRRRFSKQAQLSRSRRNRIKRHSRYL